MTPIPAFKPIVNDSFRDFDSALGVAARPAHEAPDIAHAAPDIADAESVMALKFEALYPKPTSPAAAPSGDLADGDGLSFELPPDLSSPPPVMKVRTASRPTVGEPAPERAAVAPAQARAAAPGNKRAPEQELSLDDALAVLHAAEARGKAANARSAREMVDEEDDESAADPAPIREQGLKPLSLRTEAPAAPAESRARVAANESWSARSQSLWPKVLGAAVLALVIGTGLGYVYGTSPGAGASKGKIQVTPEGGTQLRYERELKGK